MAVTTTVELPSFHPFVAIDIPWLLANRAAVQPANPFLIWEPFEGPGLNWTYSEALSDVRRIAATLRMRNVGAGDPVIVHLENSPQSILAWLACAEIGAVAVATNARCAGEEFAYFAEKSGAVGIITQPRFADMAMQYAPSVPWMLASEADGRALLADAEVEGGGHGPGHPLCIQFTSGTTARPKAVLWTHANGLWGAMVNARHMQLRADDVTLVMNPLFHTSAMAWQVLGSIWAGGTVVVEPKFSASRFWSVVNRHGCTWTTMSSFHSRALAGHPRPEHHRLRFNCGGVSMKRPDIFFGVDSIGSFGMTELITQSILNDTVGILDEGALGRPAPEYEIRIAAADGSPVGSGETGELQVKGIRGLSIFAEYFGDEAATQDAFTADGFFKTGDLVTHRPDGAILLTDRLKDMLRVGGENVAASEIETVIRAVPGVQEVAVVAGPDAMLTEIPVAFVIAAPEAPAGITADIATRCSERLADFKRPRSIRLVESLPRSFEFKVSKVELRRRLREEAGA